MFIQLILLAGAAFADQKSLCSRAVERMKASADTGLHLPFKENWTVAGKGISVVRNLAKSNLNLEKRPAEGGKVETYLRQIQNPSRRLPPRTVEVRLLSDEKTGSVSAISYNTGGPVNILDLEEKPFLHPTQGRVAFTQEAGQCVPLEQFDAATGVVWNVALCAELASAGIFSKPDIIAGKAKMQEPYASACRGRAKDGFGDVLEPLKKISAPLDKFDVRAGLPNKPKYSEVIGNTRRVILRASKMPVQFRPLVCLRAERIMRRCGEVAPEAVAIFLNAPAAAGPAPTPASK